MSSEKGRKSRDEVQRTEMRAETERRRRNAESLKETGEATARERSPSSRLDAKEFKQDICDD